MRQITRATLIAALLLALPTAASAETFTVTLDNGSTVTSRYQPKLTPDESKVMLLTEFGNWVAFPKDRVTELSSSTESRGFGRVIDTTTISLGFAPNENDPMETEGGGSTDPTTALLQYLTQRDSAQQRDYSVDQFVNTEQAGGGGFPSSYGSGFANSGNPGGAIQPGSVVLPQPQPQAGNPSEVN